MSDENLNQPLVNDEDRDENGNLRHRRVNMAVFAPTFAVIAIILTNVSADWCDFAFRSVDGTSTNNWEQSSQIGIWSYEGVGPNQGMCFWYPQALPVDSKLNSSRWFSLMAQTFGGTATLVLLFTACIVLHPKVWKTMGSFLMLSSLFQGLVFLILQSNLCAKTLDGLDATCYLRRGGRCSIAAVVFWFIAALSVLGYEQPEIPRRNGQNQRMAETVTTTEEVRPDGTKVTNTTTTYGYDA